MNRIEGGSKRAMRILKPQERAHLLLMLRTRPDRCDPHTCGKAADEIEALATIEEARREQPVPITQIQIDDAKRAVGALRYCIEADAWKGFEAAIRPLFFVAQGVLSVAALPAELAAAPKEGTDG